MHPRVKPALRRAWRDLKTAQFGVAPAHAVVLGPLDTATASLLPLLDGTRGPHLLRAEGQRIGLPHGHVDGLVRRLATAGLLDDATGGGPAADALRQRPEVLDRLRPDLASLSLVDREPTGGIRRLAARGALRVQVRGAGRVGATVASTLAGAGIGQVDVLDGGCVEPWDVAPGGLPPQSVGERRDTAARRLVQRCAPCRPHPSAPEGEGAAPEPGHAPSLSLVVLAPRDGLAAYAPDPVAAERYLASGTPHLYAGVIEGTGVVGPLVLPGASACAGCLELGRAERDPGWPRLLAQWRSGGPGGPGRPRDVQACDLALATAVAGMAAAQALVLLDGGIPAAVGARWELPLPDLGWRSESIPVRVKCHCGAGLHSEREDTSKVSEAHETMTG